MEEICCKVLMNPWNNWQNAYLQRANREVIIKSETKQINTNKNNIYLILYLLVLDYIGFDIGVYVFP